MKMRIRPWSFLAFVSAIAATPTFSGVVQARKQAFHQQLHRTRERDNNDLSSSSVNTASAVLDRIPRGGWFGSVLTGMNPFGYKITDLGEEFLRIDGSMQCDVGRFLAGLKQRKRVKAIKEQWLEVLRVAKTGQSMRIYRKIEDLVQFCLKAGFID
mmetsp:Transcript_12447/g.34553  ORF Transcript_12447/g.34553 Transcript_12447/m.34553 type:complete len:156 (+) Transcript_12447:101-568(+)|eukprot:CAMPEP_0168740556 /NCGR_PEP_ID=MMETSP0724-20121128/12049_1 /TAXON_ID=265536 /ORGANISM="Amphiprora sp., Strain CCMP467" /LENGTH=155 /DNA_ID=CAMNT_0008788013 /DNA_START=11 /DNA_END=478 /DNA_ORIENTATION=-